MLEQRQKCCSEIVMCTNAAEGYSAVRWVICGRERSGIFKICTSNRDSQGCKWNSLSALPPFLDTPFPAGPSRFRQSAWDTQRELTANSKLNGCSTPELRPSFTNCNMLINIVSLIRHVLVVSTGIATCFDKKAVLSQGEPRDAFWDH